MEEIELREYFYILRKRLWIIILITVLSVATSGLLSYYVLQPEYETFTTLMVGKPQNTDERIEYSDVLLNQQLITTYGEIAKSRVVSSEVIKNLKLPLSPGAVRGKINVTLVKDTEIIKISVTDTNPTLAARIANETAAVFMKYVVGIMRVENVQVIDKAEIPANPIKPRPMLNMAIAAALGVMIAVFIIFLLEYLDNTIKTPVDIERHLDLPILGMIPKSAEK